MKKHNKLKLIIYFIVYLLFTILTYLMGMPAETWDESEYSKKAKIKKSR